MIRRRIYVETTSSVHTCQEVAYDGEIVNIQWTRRYRKHVGILPDVLFQALGANGQQV